MSHANCSVWWFVCEKIDKVQFHGNGMQFYIWQTRKEIKFHSQCSVYPASMKCRLHQLRNFKGPMRPSCKLLHKRRKTLWNWRLVFVVTWETNLLSRAVNSNMLPVAYVHGLSCSIVWGRWCILCGVEEYKGGRGSPFLLGSANEEYTNKQGRGSLCRKF
jgi:hypothetical protein